MLIFLQVISSLDCDISSIPILDINYSFFIDEEGAVFIEDIPLHNKANPIQNKSTSDIIISEEEIEIVDLPNNCVDLPTIEGANTVNIINDSEIKKTEGISTLKDIESIVNDSETKKTEEISTLKDIESIVNDSEIKKTEG